MEVNAPARDHAFRELFMYKSRLLEYAQKSALPSPVYHTVNEGHQHAPQFRSSVLVDGKTFTSHGTFVHRKSAEHDAAKLALESLSREIESEVIPLIQQDATFCKSILLEYAVKMEMERPTYTTSQAEGILPVFISSSIFNGQTYTGDHAKNKKEAEQRAARAVIESILASSNTRSFMFEVVRSKRKLYAAFSKKGCFSGLPSERNLSSRSHTQNNSNDNVNGEELLASLTNNQLPANMCLEDEQTAKAAAREIFTPEGKKPKEEYTCELSYDANGNDSSQPTLPHGGLLAAMTSSTSNSSGGVKLTEPSTRPEDSAAVVLTTGMKRSDAMKNGREKSKKARTIEQPPAPSANPEILPGNA